MSKKPLEKKNSEDQNIGNKKWQSKRFKRRIFFDINDNNDFER